MASSSELMRLRTFATFVAGDNVTSLSSELLPDLAADLGVDIDHCYRDASCLTRLAEVIDEQTEDGTRPADNLPIEQAIEYVNRSGVMDMGPRGLHAESGVLHDHATWTVDTSHAGWLSAMTDSLSPNIKTLPAPRVLLPGRQKVNVAGLLFAPGLRIMDRQDELRYPRVKDYIENFGRAPSEEEFYYEYIRSRLSERGFEDFIDEVVAEEYRAMDASHLKESGLDEEALRPYIKLLGQREDLSNEDCVAYSVGAACITLACKLYIGGYFGLGTYFNRDAEYPQVIMVPLTLPLARDAEELEDHTKLSPYTALGSLATAAHWLIKAKVSER